MNYRQGERRRGMDRQKIGEVHNQMHKEVPILVPDGPRKEDYLFNLEYEKHVFGRSFDGVGDFYTDFMDVAEADHKDKLLDLVRNNGVYTDDNGFLREAYVELLCFCQAFDCLRALLSYETEFRIHLNRPFRTGGYPLHSAAYNLQFHLIRFLIHHGAHTGFRTLGPQPIPRVPRPRRAFRGNEPLTGLLPLNVALHSACSHSFLESWSPQRDSALKLIFLLCFPETKMVLDTVRLLAHNTQSLVLFEIVDYLCTGKLVQVALLLMAALPILPSCIPVREYRNRLDYLLPCEPHQVKDVDAMEYLSGCIGNQVEEMTSNQPEEITSNQAEEITSNASLLLQVFEKVGPDLYQYVQADHSQVPHMKIIEDVKTLLLRGSFMLSEKDTDFSILGSYIKTDDVAVQEQKPLSAPKPDLPWDSPERKIQEFRYHSLFMSQKRTPLSLIDVSLKRTYRAVGPTTRDFGTSQIAYGAVPTSGPVFSRKYSTVVGSIVKKVIRYI